MKPILYQTQMIAAIRAGQKTVTRRTKGLEEINKNPNDWEIKAFCVYKKPGDDIHEIQVSYNFINRKTKEIIKIKTPYGFAKNTELYIRETWKPVGWGEEIDGWAIKYKDGTITIVERLFEDDEKEQNFIEKITDELMEKQAPMDEDQECFYDVEKYLSWRPSIFMPKNAARLFLKITNVRPERLLDITEEDAIAEGIPRIDKDTRAIPLFFSLWNSINGKKMPWKKNPWVWRIEFKVTEDKTKYQQSERQCRITAC